MPIEVEGFEPGSTASTAPKSTSANEFLPARWPEHLQTRRDRIEAFLSQVLPSPLSPDTENLHKAMHQAVLGSGGKRMRPLLTVLAAEACGGCMDRALPAAAAVELIHACSLVQDDLPAMDNDRIRRGQPSCHVQFGEATAILTGDALLAAAFEILADPLPGLPIDRQLRMISLLARSIGLHGMAGGQAADLGAARGRVSTDTLKTIHERKTGAFLQACLLLGGYSAGASEGEKQALETFGMEIGLAFQIIDDLLNEVGLPGITGKPLGSDRALDKGHGQK